MKSTLLEAVCGESKNLRTTFAWSNAYRSGQGKWHLRFHLKVNYDGYAECVRTVFHPNRVTVARLVEYLFEIIDPYSVNKQGPDIGEKYRSGIYSASEQQLHLNNNISKKQDHGYDQG